MNLSAHLQMLRAKHQKLDVQIEKDASDPGHDWWQLKEDKKKKLRLKEEIHRISG